MAYNLRLFGYKGIVQAHQRLIKQFSAESVFMLEEPYLWSAILVVPEGTQVAVSSLVVNLSPDTTTIMRMEVPDGKQVRYEINPLGPLAASSRVAGNLSPRWSGFDNFPWGAGYTLSAVNAADFL